MKKVLNSIYIVCFIIMVGATGCDKTMEYPTITPPPQAHFVGAKFQSYQILSATQPVYNIGLGTTDVATSDRVITYKVTSPTNAVAGTHYSIVSGGASGTVTIPAGQALANIALQGIYAPYNATGRKDTLVFTLTEPSLKSAAFSDTVKLALRGPCFEGDVTMGAFLGNYANTIETFGTGAPYGPYLTKITSSVLTSPTTGTIVVTNIWDNGWGPLTFNLDWTDPANRTATVVALAAIPGSNAGDLNPTYAGQTIAVRPFAGQAGTFSACNNKFTLKMQLGVTALGFFGSLYTVNMSR
jgi:hypothetical protein